MAIAPIIAKIVINAKLTRIFRIVDFIQIFFLSFVQDLEINSKFIVYLFIDIFVNKKKKKTVTIL